MTQKMNIPHILIFLSLISFGFFGSLSHVFSFFLVIYFIFKFFLTKNKVITRQAVFLFFALFGVFSALFLRGLFNQNVIDVIASLNPMLPIPIIGILILFTGRNKVIIKSEKIALFSQVSVIFSFFIYLLLSQVLTANGYLQSFVTGRIELFSGNPIPFSIALFGVSVFCFSNWDQSKNTEKFIAICCFILAAYSASILSGARGTFLSTLVSVPFILYLVTRSICLSFILTLIGLGITLMLIYLSQTDLFYSRYLDNIHAGIQTLFNSATTDYSNGLRLQMWLAAIDTIKNAPLFGYNISNGFLAIVPNLPASFGTPFSHPHNDIFACTIGGGILTGILCIVSLLSPLWAAIFSKENKGLKILLGCIISINLFINANVNTVLFNDITAAWLAFSTFLIASIKPENTNKKSEFEIQSKGQILQGRKRKICKWF